VARMRWTQSVALVRVGSQWGAAEADASSSGEWGEVDGKFRPKFPAFQVHRQLVAATAWADQ